MPTYAHIGRLVSWPPPDPAAPAQQLLPIPVEGDLIASPDASVHTLCALIMLSICRDTGIPAEVPPHAGVPWSRPGNLQQDRWTAPGIIVLVITALHD